MATKLYVENNKKITYNQNLPNEIHYKIVRLLEDSERALTNRDLSSKFGIKYSIDPYKLPTGKILAYGLNLERLNTKNCGFVLNDWVSSTKIQERGKIDRRRILTPINLIPIQLTKDQIYDLIFSSDIYDKWGLIDVNDLKNKVSREIRIDGDDLYHQEIIRNKIFEILKKDKSLYYCGNNIYCNTVYEEIFAQNINLRRKRLLCLNEILENRPWHSFIEEVELNEKDVLERLKS